MCDGGGVPSEIRNKIEPWIGRSFFALEHPTAKVKMLYTNSWCTRERGAEEDPSKTLVMYAPKGARVQLVSQEMPELEKDAPKWLRDQQELRGQILIMCHDNSGHPTATQTEVQVKAVAYWREMEHDIREHIHTCADCLPEMKAQQKAGTGIISIQRFVCMQMDHFVMKAEWQKACGVHEILTLTDMATRVTSYEVAESQKAVETARIIHDRWIPYYTTPDEIVSDSHPAFASEVMAELRQILGIKGHDLATPGAKGKTAMVESRHNLLSMTLADGFAKGDIKNARDLQTYCSKAKRRWDHDTNKEVTPFECVTGQKPRSVRSLAFVPKSRKEVRCMHLRQRISERAEQDLKSKKGWTEVMTRSDEQIGRTKDQQDMMEEQPRVESRALHKNPAITTEQDLRTERDLKLEDLKLMGREYGQLGMKQDQQNVMRPQTRARSHALHGQPAIVSTLRKKMASAKKAELEMGESEWLKWIRKDEVMEGDRPTRRTVEEQPEEENEAFHMKDTRGKAQVIFKHAEEKVMQNVLKRDRTARDNILSRQRKNSKSPYAVDFQLAVGDEVSYDGVLHKIKAVNGPPGEAITSTIQVKGSEKTRKVRMSELRPTATPRPTTFLEREELNYGDFVFYEGDEEVRGGRVTCTDDDDAIVVHIFEGTAGTLAMWLPTWINKRLEQKRAKKEPAGFARLEETVDRRDIIMKGTLTATDRMTASTVKEAVNRGLLTKE